MSFARRWALVRTDSGSVVRSRSKRFYRNSSPAVARVVRDLYFVGKLKQREIGRMFGMRQNSVSRIVSGQVWSDHALR